MHLSQKLLCFDVGIGREWRDRWCLRMLRGNDWPRNKVLHPSIREGMKLSDAGSDVASIGAQSKSVVLQKLHELRWRPIFLFLLFRLFIRHS